MKAHQSSKLREIGDTLVRAGFVSLDEQASALGLPRSTTWTILKANHKSSGLSAAVINRMLGAPQLPPPVRIKILEYVEEKNAGIYGHNKLQIRRFINGLWALEAAQLGSASSEKQHRERHFDYA